MCLVAVTDGGFQCPPYWTALRFRVIRIFRPTKIHTQCGVIILKINYKCECRHRTARTPKDRLGYPCGFLRPPSKTRTKRTSVVILARELHGARTISHSVRQIAVRCYVHGHRKTPLRDESNSHGNLTVTSRSARTYPRNKKRMRSWEIKIWLKNVR